MSQCATDGQSSCICVPTDLSLIVAEVFAAHLVLAIAEDVLKYMYVKLRYDGVFLDILIPQLQVFIAWWCHKADGALYACKEGYMTWPIVQIEQERTPHIKHPQGAPYRKPQKLPCLLILALFKVKLLVHRGDQHDMSFHSPILKPRHRSEIIRECFAKCVQQPEI